MIASVRVPDAEERSVAFNQKLLYNDEQVIIDRHPHWWFLAPAVAALVASCVLGILAKFVWEDTTSNVQQVARYGAAVLIVVALLWLLLRLIKWRSTEFVVTTERCVYRSGVFSKEGIEIPLDRINTVFFNQTLFERLLKAGDLAIESAGENSRQEFSDIFDPMKVQNRIYQLMEDNENRKYDRVRTNPNGGAPGGISVAEQIEKLHQLLQQGALTAEQFEAQKAQLLG